jgi:hypothetical protein
MAKTIGDGDQTDFDETRRLLYMALLVSRTKRYNLGGTLVNALKHHHAVDLDADEIADHVVGLLEQAPTKAEDETWVREQITRITAELGG